MMLAVLLLSLCQLLSAQSTWFDPSMSSLRRLLDENGMCITRDEYARLSYNQLAKARPDKWGMTDERDDELLEKTQLRKGQDVLDLGTGLGNIAIRAKKVVGTKGMVVAVDIAEEAVRRARQLAKKQGQNVFFRVENINDLEPFLTKLGKQFDVIFCQAALVHVEEPAEALELWARFLKAGGRIIFDVNPRVFHPDLGAVDKAALKLGIPSLLSKKVSDLNTKEKITELVVSAGLEAQVEKSGTLRKVRITRDQGRTFIKQTMQLRIYSCFDTRRFETYALQYFDAIFDRKAKSDPGNRNEKAVTFNLYSFDVFAIKPE